MARAGAFEGIDEAATAELAYWRLRGGREIGDILLVPADPNLESEVREKAEADLRQSALSSGILTTAEGNARATLTTMLHSLGFQQITFR